MLPRVACRSIRPTHSSLSFLSSLSSLSFTSSSNPSPASSSSLLSISYTPPYTRCFSSANSQGPCDAPVTNSQFHPLHIQEGDELAFAWITPKAIVKGHEGGILARLLATPGLNLMGARMFAPSDAMVDEMIQVHKDTYKPKPFKPFVDFLNDNLKERNASKQGMPNHVMFMLFSGKDVRAKLTHCIGDYLPDPRVGMVGRTIRGAYGDYKRLPNGDIEDFQPAIVHAGTSEANRQYLKVFAKYAEKDGGIVEDWYNHLDKYKSYESGMVMIKPDMLEKPSSLPGNIMDMLGSTGLHLVGCRVFSFSLDQAYDFYGFLEDIFVSKLSGKLEEKLRKALHNQMPFTISDDDYAFITQVLKRKFAKHEVNQIIKYMSGIDPSPLSQEDLFAIRTKPGKARCFALLYRGTDAIQTIRTKLGSTDPTKAEIGTIRSDYGKNLMMNGCHASDSQENMMRERKIINFLPDSKSCVKETIEQWLERKNHK